jgi:hypothetical protein
MPVNYDLLTNEITYQGLADLQVLVEDSTSNSPDYFRVSKLPKEFTSGKNTFHFKGNTKLFNEGSYVYIEILDSNGEPLYYEISLDLESTEQTAIVTAFVKPDTPPGTGYIIICSTASKDADGNYLDNSQINVRWKAPIYIDASKRNDSDIIFDKLPTVEITASTGSYTNLNYSGGSRFLSASLTNLEYYKLNDKSVLVTSSTSPVSFDTTALNGTVTIDKTYLTGSTLNITDNFYTTTFSEISKGFLVLDTPISLNIYNSISKYEPNYVFINSASVLYELSASLPGQITENSYNLATVYFTGLDPITGTISKIRSYYRSAGVGEYIFANETNIENISTEFGFTPDIVTASLSLPTIHRLDKFDFKFEFVNPSGYVSKQVVESLNNTFIGGNTYIGGDDNLLTGSLYVAGETGTGVEITGKQNVAMIRSLGYTGFANGNAGFVMYSGSIQSALQASENYSGVGLELYANTSSYFKYKTANGGQLLIRTSDFYIGNENIFISASNSNLEILNRISGSGIPTKTKFHLYTNGTVLASAFIAVTGSNDASSSKMLDTSIGLVDGKNIGRIVYTQTTPINYWTRSPYTGSTSFLQQATTPSLTVVDISNTIKNTINSGSVYNPWLNYNSLIPDISYYALPFENTITVLGNVYVDKYQKYGTDPGLALAIRCTLWTTITSSYSNFGLSGNILSGSYGADAFLIAGTSGSIYKTGNIIDNGLGLIITYNTVSGSTQTVTPFKLIVNVPTDSQDRINMINLDYAFFTVASGSYNVDFDFRAKIANITLLSGRHLFSDSLSGTGDAVLPYPSQSFQPPFQNIP